MAEALNYRRLFGIIEIFRHVFKPDKVFIRIKHKFLDLFRIRNGQRTKYLVDLFRQHVINTIGGAAKVQFLVFNIGWVVVEKTDWFISLVGVFIKKLVKVIPYPAGP